MNEAELAKIIKQLAAMRQRKWRAQDRLLRLKCRGHSNRHAKHAHVSSLGRSLANGRYQSRAVKSNRGWE